MNKDKCLKWVVVATNNHDAGINLIIKNIKSGKKIGWRITYKEDDKYKKMAGESFLYNLYGSKLYKLPTIGYKIK